MRKALQAEQRKAEMLIKIRQLQDTCEELDQEVEDYKRKIRRMLKEEEADKERGVETFAAVRQEQSDKGKNLLTELDRILKAINQWFR